VGSKPLQPMQSTKPAANDNNVFWALVNTLIQQFSSLFGVPFPEGKSLFVSCHYRGDQLDVIKKLARARGFHVFTGRDLLSDPSIKAGLPNRMRCCSHFLGVWSRDGA
jgi:hypothetical protein